MYRGYIKTWRKVLSSDMYRSLTSSQRDVFWVVLLLANHETHNWEWNGEIYECKPGQFVTSLASLKKLCAKDTSLKNIRTALDKLEKWQFLANISAKTGRLITIVNWDTYQIETERAAKLPAKNRQTGGKAPATNKNDKNAEEVFTPSNGDEKKPFREYVFISQTQYDRLIKDFGKRQTESMMDTLDNYIGAMPQKRNKYKDHNRVLRGWVLEKFQEKRQSTYDEPEVFLN